MRTVFSCVALLLAMGASAENDSYMAPLKLEVPELKAELVTMSRDEVQPMPSVEFSSSCAPSMDFDFFKSKTNPGVKPYRFMDDMTFVGVPLFVAGWAIKGDKAMFRVNNKSGKKNTQLLTDFKTGIDDYTQFFGPAMVVGLKLGGVEGRSDWPRLLASAGMSYGIMAILVNGIKYSAKEMRPDGSTRNSWPSGHTATSFVGATLLHKEYGLTRSPWYSVAGYGVATATGVMRVLNNRHWVSDVMSGAGLGILSTELGYAIGDVLFKGKGLLRNDLLSDSENPSFFSISMGVGLGQKSIEFRGDDLQDQEKFDSKYFDIQPDESESVQFRSATVVDAEGAYFFNKYIGVGGRFRVRAMSAKSFGQYADIASEEANSDWVALLGGIYQKAGQNLNEAAMKVGGDPITNIGGIVKSDHMAEFTASVGLYLNLPVSKQISFGTKFLIGRSITQELDIDGYAEGNIKEVDYDMHIHNGDLYVDPNTGKVDFKVHDPVSTGETYREEWDYLTLGANNSTSYGTGISITYRYKSNFSWKLFCDYDYTKKTYTLTLDPYHFMKSALGSSGYDLVNNQLVSPYAPLLDPLVYKKVKRMNYFTIGLSFAVNL